MPDFVAWLVLGLLALNGLRVVIGLPPLALWFRSYSCDKCKGVGWIKK